MTDRLVRAAYRRWIAPLVAEQVSLTLIRWREKGNFLSTEQRKKLDQAIRSL